MQTREFYLRSHPLIPPDDRRVYVDHAAPHEIAGAFWVGFFFGAGVLAVIGGVAWLSS